MSGRHPIFECESEPRYTTNPNLYMKHVGSVSNTQPPGKEPLLFAWNDLLTYGQNSDVYESFMSMLTLPYDGAWRASATLLNHSRYSFEP